MKKLLALSFLLLTLSSCCKSKFVGSYLFNDFERNLIPYDGSAPLVFVNGDGQTFRASTEPLEIRRQVVGNCADCCEEIEEERTSGDVRFLQDKFFMDFLMNTTEFGTVFRLRYGELNEAADFVIYDQGFCIQGYVTGSLTPSLLQDIKVLEFVYEDVLVLEDCNIDDGKEKVKIILFSPENGIEFVEYKNGSYLKLLLE